MLHSRWMPFLAVILLFSSTLGANLSALSPELISDGDAGGAGDDFGRAVALADLDGDGRDEVVVGAPFNDSAGDDAGAVYVFFGPASLSPGGLAPAGAGVILQGAAAGGLFGYSVANAGDLNGDGLEDLLVGAPGIDGGSGAAYLFLGGRLANATAAGANATVLGPGAPARLGTAVAGAGDLNGDGLGDFAVGAPGGAWRGEVLVFFGENYPAPVRIPDLPANATLLSPWSPSFGAAVAGAGDLNGDGFDDLAAGGGSDERAFIFYGSRSFDSDFQLRLSTIVPSAINATDDTGQALGDLTSDDGTYYRVAQGRTMFLDCFNTTALNGTVHSAVLNCTFRTRAAWAWWNDFTATSFIRCAVPPGALADTSLRPQYSPFKSSLGGFELTAAGVQNISALSGLRIHYLNNDAGTQADSVDFDHLYVAVAWSAAPNVTISGARNSRFGTCLSAAGDQNADGFDELVAGAPAAYFGQGSAFIFFGGARWRSWLNDTDARVRLNGTTGGDGFGSSVRAGRVSLDGTPDLVVGAPGAGKVYLFNGSAAMRNLTAAGADGIVSGSPGGLFGAAVAAGDANGLGFDEVLIGAPGHNGTGRAILSGNADERIVSRPLELAFHPSGDPTINETEEQPFGVSLLNPAGELVTVQSWYLDRAAQNGETGPNYTYRSNYTSAGEHNITVVVADGIRTASHRWTVHVVDVNAPPFVGWQPPGDTGMDEGTNLTLRSDAYDVDGDTLTFRWSNDGKDLGMNQPSFSFRPDFDEAGSYLIECTVDDGHGHLLWHSWNVSVRNVNRPPVIDARFPEPEVVLDEGTSVELTVAAHDPDGDTVTIMWYVGPRLVAVDVGSFLFEADYRSAGQSTLKAVISDGELTASSAWNLTILHQDVPPVIISSSPPGDILLDEGRSARFCVTARDPNGDPVNISWLVDGALQASGDFSFLFQSSPESNREYLVQALLSDGPNTVFRNWTIRVNHAPRMSTWNPREDLTYIEPGQEAFFFVTPVDPDDDPLTLEWYLDGRLEAGMRGNSVRFAPGPSSTGRFRMAVTVTDGRLLDTHEWTVVVNASAPGAPVPDIGIIPRQPGAGEYVTFSARGSRADFQLVNWSWDLGDGSLAYAEEFPHRYAEAGTYLVRLTVTDASGNRATATATVEVRPPGGAASRPAGWGLPAFAAVLLLVIVLLVVIVLQRRALKRLAGR